MKISSTAKRYGRALFELAQKKGQVNEILSELKTFVSIIEENHDLLLVLKQPYGSRHENLLKELIKGKFSELSYHFILLLLKNNRLLLLQQIVNDYQIRVDELNNLKQAVVISAVPISEQIFQELKNQLKNFFRSDVRIENKVDPSILGGIIIRIDGKVFNASIQDKFKKMKIYLTKN